MITLITGPMKSGKSTEMFRQMERKHLAGKKVLYVGPKADTRAFYARGIPKSSLFAVARVQVVDDWNKIPSKELKKLVKDFDAIFVDEYFMIENNVRLIEHLANEANKDLVFGGLLADANAKLWTEAAEILPYCDNVVKLLAICECCGSEYANFSYKKGIEAGQIDVGDSKYKVLCRHCYLSKSKK